MGTRYARLLSWAFAAAVLAAAALWLLSRPSREFLRLAWSRSPECSLPQVWASIGEAVKDSSRTEAIFQATRVAALEGGFERIATPKGDFWAPRGNQDMLAETIAGIESEEYGDAATGVRPGDVVLDCGANVGVYTRHALARGARLVVAVELAPENLECLRRNFDADVRAGRVIVYPKGVWDKDDELTLRTSARSSLDTVVLDRPGHRPGPKVALTTIDKLVEELKLERVDFIKMDVEGAEHKALAGAARTVERFRPRLAVSVEHLPGDSVTVAALIGGTWPAARVDCGPCTRLHSALGDRVQPRVLFVSWQSPGAR